MRIEVAKEKVFEPKWGGNADLPERERIKVYHRFLTPGERKKYIYTKPVRIKDGGTEPLEFVQDEEGIARAIITKIENLTISAGGKDVKIETARALYDTEGVPSALVTEIEVYCLTASPEIDTDPLE